MNASIVAAALSASLMLLQPVWAHTNELLDAMPAPHGGQVRAAGPYHLELVAKEGELILHVTDHAWQEMKTDGGEGKASIQQDKTGAKITVKLEPSPQNLLTGRGEFQIKPETVIVVFVKMPGQEAYGAKFTPLKLKTVGAGKKMREAHDHDLQHHHH